MNSKIILCAGLLVLAGLPALNAADVKPAKSAKAEKSAKPTADERRLAELGKIYSLTGEQQRKLKLLFEERAVALDVLKGNSALDEKTRAQQSRAIYNRIDREFTALLTPAQQRLKKRLAKERAAEAEASK